MQDFSRSLFLAYILNSNLINSLVRSSIVSYTMFSSVTDLHAIIHIASLSIVVFETKIYILLPLI